MYIVHRIIFCDVLGTRYTTQDGEKKKGGRLGLFFFALLFSACSNSGIGKGDG